MNRQKLRLGKSDVLAVPVPVHGTFFGSIDMSLGLLIFPSKCRNRFSIKTKQKGYWPSNQAEKTGDITGTAIGQWSHQAASTFYQTTYGTVTSNYNTLLHIFLATQWLASLFVQKTVCFSYFQFKLAFFSPLDGVNLTLDL
jgi:hypothetical protein